MNWFKKPSSAPLRKVVLSIISINVIVMIMIEQYLASFVFASIVFGDIYTNYRNKTKKVDKEISADRRTPPDKTASAACIVISYASIGFISTGSLESNTIP